ncbi:hypothetical protein [Polycyclovorans algicola]|uniref:hypothetical protein n=1 Tax=Polycyclovorans algicola TaxID=616992 RepID=UPI001268D7C2|nr:hypothetical protein [Polycyclovorans algicola]
MKVLVISITLLLISARSQAAPDFLCQGVTQYKEMLSVEIYDISTANEVKVKIGGDSCDLEITSIIMSYRSKVPHLTIKLNGQSCEIYLRGEIRKEGHLRVRLETEETHVDLLARHQPINCTIINFEERSFSRRFSQNQLTLPEE